MVYQVAILQVEPIKIIKIMKKLGYIETSSLTSSKKEQLQKHFRECAVVCLSTDKVFRAFGEIEENLRPDHNLDNYRDDPYFDMLRKQYMLVRFIEDEYFRKYGNSYCSFDIVKEYLDSIDDLRTLDEYSCLEEIDKMILNKISLQFSKI